MGNNRKLYLIVFVAVFMLIPMFVLCLSSKNVKSKKKCGEGLKCVEAEDIIRSYDYKDIAGVFKFSDDDCSYTLVLSEDGMFKYSYGCGWNQTIYGNYIIKGDRLFINKIFETGSDPSVKIFDDDYVDELIITGNDFIIDNSSVVKTITDVDEIYFKRQKDEKYDIRSNYNDVLVKRVTDIISHCND